MSGPVTRRALRRSLDQIRYISPVRPRAAEGLVAAVYAQVEHDFGMLAPPVALHSPAPGPLAACWLMLRETLLSPGLAGRPAKETVAAAVSAANACPYCTTVHAAAITSLSPGEVFADVAAGRVSAISDPRLRALATWAKASRRRELAAAHSAPFPGEQAPELVGVAVTFHYLNRMVSIFLGDSPLPPQVPGALGGLLMRVLGRILVSAQPATAAPALLPASELPADLAWSAPSRRIAAAFAQAGAAIELAGLEAVPALVRELTLGELAGWHGDQRGPGRSWTDSLVARLPAAERAAGRLALLSAFAPYQVLDSDVGEFRSGSPEDEALIGLTSWASFAAARRIGSWLGAMAVS
jgi:AhpD family alkylhydroperoxidase